MANRISILKSEAVGALPTASAMASGELAVNYADKKIYGKHPGSGAVVQVAASPIHTHTISDVTNLSSTLDNKIGKNSSDASPVSTIRCMTQAEYDALGSYDSQTLYFIK